MYVYVCICTYIYTYARERHTMHAAASTAADPTYMYVCV